MLVEDSEECQEDFVVADRGVDILRVHLLRFWCFPYVCDMDGLVGCYELGERFLGGFDVPRPS